MPKAFLRSALELVSPKLLFLAFLLVQVVVPVPADGPHFDKVKEFKDGIEEVVGVAVRPFDNVKINPADPATFNTEKLTDNPNPRATAEEIGKITKSLTFMMAANYDGDALQSWTCYPCVRSPTGTTVLKTFRQDERGVYSYLAYNKEWNALVLAFRGTVTREGWIQDFKFWHDKLGDEFACHDDKVKVHHGFFQSYQSARDDVMRAIDENSLVFPGADIHVVGFSLGGALAVLYATALATRFKHKKINLTTYGQPRVGNKEFAKYVESLPNLTTMRLVHYRDWVPTSPPAIFGYRHHGTEFFVTTRHGKEMVKCKAEDSKCSSGTVPSATLNLHLHCPGYSF